MRVAIIPAADIDYFPFVRWPNTTATTLATPPIRAAGSVDGTFGKGGAGGGHGWAKSGRGGRATLSLAGRFWQCFGKVGGVRHCAIDDRQPLGAADAHDAGGVSLAQ